MNALTNLWEGCFDIETAAGMVGVTVEQATSHFEWLEIRMCEDDE
jgi:hypothetical protein